jgi:hypothetical protein
LTDNAGKDMRARIKGRILAMLNGSGTDTGNKDKNPADTD